MKVLYTGSFNPWHKGHQYVYDCACEYFGKDNVFIGIGVNPAKLPNPKEQQDHLDFLKWTLVPITKNVITYTGLTSEVCKENNIHLIIRGIRPGKSLDYEEDLMYWNMKLGNIKTIFIPTPPEINQISSSVIRELKNYDNIPLEDYVNLDVYWRWMIGKKPKGIVFFGPSCSGKSYHLKNYYSNPIIHPDDIIDCDKVIWDYVDLDKLGEMLNSESISHDVCYTDNDDLVEEYKRELLIAIRFNKTKIYNNMMIMLAECINYEKMFDKGYYYDAAIIGAYWFYIPIKIRSKFRFVRISTNEDNREKFAKAKCWNPEFLNALDKFYVDPPYWDEEIIIE